MIDSEEDLFVRELRQLYHIERELEELQSGLAGDATREEVEEFYMAHSETTTEQLGRLEEIFDAIQVDIELRESAALAGLRDDREEVLADVTDPTLEDLVDVEFGKTLERLEISKLETLLALSDRINLDSEHAESLREMKREAEDAVDALEERSVV